MRIALIADTFPPLRTSGAVQLRDLAREFVRQGHEITAILPAPGLDGAWTIQREEGVEVVRLRAPATKDIPYFKRALGELLMPYRMLQNLGRSPVAQRRWDAVIWYAPSIFLAPVASALKRRSQCRSYLILRDIFPEWAVNMGLMGRGLAYRFFRLVESYQYRVADTIGIQCSANADYFAHRSVRPMSRLDVLHNWLAPAANQGCSISLADSGLAGRKVFVYAGNMGAAQGLDLLLDLAARLNPRTDVGFLFVGRGTESQRLRDTAERRQLSNVIFRDEIHPDEMPGLLAQCHAGLVALDCRHQTHNIPGKFLAYMQAGLPVLASINPGNDLQALIVDEDVGRVSTVGSVEALQPLAEALLDDNGVDPAMAARCRAVYQRMFRPEAAVSQIVAALTV